MSSHRTPTIYKWLRLVVAAVVSVLIAGLIVVVSPPPPGSAAVSPGKTERASVNDDGKQVPAHTSAERTELAISGDGNQVAFAHSALIDTRGGTDGELSGFNIYLRDRATHHTVLISHNDQGAPAGGDSADPSLSLDGRYVAFSSTAKDIPAPGVDTAPQREVYICDRDPDGDGVFDELNSSGGLDYRYIWVGNSSIRADGADAITNSSPSISHSGATIAWTEEYSQIGQETEVGVYVETFAKDAYGRLPSSPASSYQLHGQGAGFTRFTDMSLAAGGQYVVFAAETTTTEDEEIPTTAVFVLDLETRTYHRVDLDSNGGFLSGTKVGVQISGNGRMVAFMDWIDRDLDGERDPATEYGVHVFDRDPDANGGLWPADPRYVSEVVSRDPQGKEQHGSSPALSADGRYIAFQTNAPGMHNGIDRVTIDDDGNVTQSTIANIVVRDILRDRENAEKGRPRTLAELTSPSIKEKEMCGEYKMQPGDVCEGDGPSFASRAISADGRVIAFWSAADDLVDGDTNRSDSADGYDVFVRELQPTITVDSNASDIGQVRIGSSGTMVFNVSHVGFGPVYVDDVRFAGPDSREFAISTTNCAGAVLHHRHPLDSPVNCQVVATFTPRVNGPHGAVLEPRHATLRFETRYSEPVTVPLTIAVGQPVNGRQTVSLDPTVAASGRATVVSGTGFAGDFPVTIQVTGTPDSESITVTTDRQGEFKVQLPIGRSVMPGRWPVTVTVPDTDIEASTSLLVLQGTQQPPNYNTRR